MKKSLQMAHPRSPGGSDADGTDHLAYDQSIIIPNIAADSFERKQLSWFATSQIPTDLAVQVQEVIFNVHKISKIRPREENSEYFPASWKIKEARPYPLVSKSGYIRQLELQPSISNFGHDLKLENFPGGSETFEMILKFFYGLPVDLNPNNIAALRCASEYLEMTEEFEDGNLIAKTEAFLTFVVLASWKDTITVLKSCETLSPWAENLQIVRRCCDSIAYKVSRRNSSTEDVSEESWWFDDVATLHIDHFMRIMTAIRAKGTKAEIIGKCIMNYADKWLPDMDEGLEGLRGYGFGKSELQFSILIKKEEESAGQNKEQRTIIESLVSILPSQNGAVSCKFLMQMLKTAMVYSASPALISDLEKRIGMMLEDANVYDLLIPNYKNEDRGIMLNSSEQRTMHNIEVVQRILDYFLMHGQQQQQQQKIGKTNVSKLLDNYLAEIAKDPNLSITKFQVLAEYLPQNARSCDDGLYRAIDIYLKTHPSLSEHDRRRLCKIMNCEKLSFDACMHAAQNDRLPLRTVVQVLFSEQAKMRMEMQGKEPVTRGDNSEQEEHRPSTNTEIKNLKSELENVKTKMTGLQNDYSELQQEYEKICSKHKNALGWSLNWRKIKNSFHVKAESDDNGDGQKRQNPGVFRLSFRRRRSVS